MSNFEDGLKDKLEKRFMHPLPIPMLQVEDIESMVGWVICGALSEEKPAYKQILEVRKLVKYWNTKGLINKRIVDMCVDYIFQHKNTIKKLSQIMWKKDPWSAYLAVILINGPLREDRK